jgi:hypothetical protein
VKGALDPLDYIMTIFATSCQGVINSNCPKCTIVTIDEHKIMGAVAAWQKNNDLLKGNAYICSWLPLTAIRVIRQPAYHLARTLKQGNLIIRLHPWVCALAFDNTRNSNHKQTCLDHSFF